jgi:hypothetical protein
MSVAPNGAILAASIPGGPVRFNSTLTNSGTPLTYISGPTSAVDTIVFDKHGQGWYTDSGAGGNGSFGKINIDFTNNTFTTQQVLTGPATHGAAYDSQTDTIILMGAGSIAQFDVNTQTIIGQINGLGGTFDQGAVDSNGHVFAANNDGNLTFIDYSTTGNIASAKFVSTQFLANSLDDVAPLSGLGSTTPEPASVVLLGLGVAGLAGYGLRRRKPSVHVG